MDIDTIIKLLNPELLIVIPMCWGLGLLLKSIKEIPNRFIPISLFLISIIITFLFVYGKNEICNMSLRIFFIITQATTLWAISWSCYDRFIKPGLIESFCGIINNIEVSKDEEKKDIP